MQDGARSVRDFHKWHRPLFGFTLTQQSWQDGQFISSSTNGAIGESSARNVQLSNLQNRPLSGLTTQSERSGQFSNSANRLVIRLHSIAKSKKLAKRRHSLAARLANGLPKKTACHDAKKHIAAPGKISAGHRTVGWQVLHLLAGRERLEGEEASSGQDDMWPLLLRLVH